MTHAQITIEVKISKNPGYFWEDDVVGIKTEFVIPVEVTNAIDYTTIVRQTALNAVREWNEKRLAEKEEIHNE